jgi:hypothetical protein
MNVGDAIKILGNAVLPHCDQSVLHAPGECRYCDERPEWQALRVIWGVSFTGHPVVADTGVKVMCPSDAARGIGGAHVWPGNTPKQDNATKDEGTQGS